MKWINSGKVLLLCLLCNTALFSQNPIIKKLSSADHNLASAAHIDPAAMQIIREETDSAFSQMTVVRYEYSESSDSYIRKYIQRNAVVFGADAESSYNIVLKLKDKLAAIGHLIFIFEKDKSSNRYSIAVTQSDDQFDILRLVETNGERYRITNEMIVDKLNDWNRRYPFTIIAANNDYIEAEFSALPPNMEAFANEVYEFCPDVVDSGSGSVKYLAAEMKNTRTLYLWWKKVE